jgi:hypothetical protein
MTESAAFVLAASLELGEGVDTRAPGGEVTVALCGHWEHEGPCRWPHHSSIDASVTPARLRTVVAAPGEDRAEVVQRVTESLDVDGRWTVVSLDVEDVAADEQDLARNLEASPRAAPGNRANDQGRRPQ